MIEVIKSGELILEEHGYLVYNFIFDNNEYIGYIRQWTELKKVHIGSQRYVDVFMPKSDYACILRKNAKEGISYHPLAYTDNREYIETFTLPTTNISFSKINVELGRGSSNRITLNDSQVRQLGGKPSGKIAFSDLAGKSWEVTIIDAISFSNGDDSYNKDITGTTKSYLNARKIEITSGSSYTRSFDSGGCDRRNTVYSVWVRENGGSYVKAWEHVTDSSTATHTIPPMILKDTTFKAIDVQVRWHTGGKGRSEEVRRGGGTRCTDHKGIRLSSSTVNLSIIKIPD